MKNHRRAAFVVAGTIILSGGVLAGCSSANEPDAAETSLVMLQPEPSQGLDPNLAFADASRIPMAMIYETLVERDENGDIVGSLASDWEVSEDGRVWTFTLRDDSAFSDGTVIAPSDVVFSLERAQEGAVLGSQLQGVTFDAEGDDQVVVTLPAPSSGLLTTLATPGSAGILSQAAVEAGGDSYFTKPKATSGPWSLEEYTPKNRAEFVANTHYYNVPKVMTINYTFSEDPTSHAAAVQSGTADIVGIGYADAQTLKKATGTGVQVVDVDLLAPLFWGWDRTRAPFDDKRVRQAVAWAVDRQGRMDACWFGTGANTYGNIIRPWDPAYQEIDTYKADTRAEALDKAEELLDEAGWVDDGTGTRVAKGVAGAADGDKLQITVPYEGNWPAAECHVQLLQQNLADVGIEVTPQSYDASAYWGEVAKNAFTMYHGGAGAIDAADLYFNWFDSNGSLTALTTHLNDPEIDAQVATARAATDPAEAIKIYQDLEEWQADELPMLVVGYQWPQTALGPRVSNWTDHVDNDSRWLVAITVAD